MKCEHCLKEIPQPLLEQSHDVPCYLFFIEAIGRRKRKPFADKYGSRWLCHVCHTKYEVELRDLFIKTAVEFAKTWDKNENGI